MTADVEWEVSGFTGDDSDRCIETITARDDREECGADRCVHCLDVENAAMVADI